MITWKFARLNPSTQWPAVRTLVGPITEPLQCIWPLRKMATAKGHCAGSARVPPTTDEWARGLWRTDEAAAGNAATSVAEARASTARRLRFRRLGFIGGRVRARDGNAART